jgi:alpha-tubulin suppressor-like RCC1 family protein
MCILDAAIAGTTATWGQNNYGQLGDNSTTQSLVPVGVNTSGVLNGKTVIQTSAGNADACAVTSDGGAYCWGNNGLGSLGDNSTTNSLVPVAVDTSGALSGKTVVQLSAGSSYTNCAVTSDGRAYCWGNNGNGQLGSPGANPLVPNAVDTSGVLNGKIVTQIAVGSYHACAVTSDGGVYCWGSNVYGQLGNNGGGSSSVPVAVNTSGVLNGKTVTQVSASQRSTCVVTSDGGVYCWGQNSNGQLGNNSTTSSPVPVAVNTSGVLNGKTVTQLGMGYNGVCVVTSDGGAYCWGNNSNGQLGNNSTTQSLVPIAVDTSGVLNGGFVSQVSVPYGNYSAVVARYAPTVNTGAASSITASGATLNGTVTANGAITTVTFEYGLTSGYGSSAIAAESPLSLGASSAAVTAAVTGLTCNTTYHFRVNANNGIGGTINGADATFTTAACPTYTIGGTISGLTASGLVLTDSSAGSSPITSGATSFTLPTAINYNGSYAVTVQTQPTGQTCTVNNGTGSNVTANVSSVSVTCTTNTYIIGGTISGLTASGLVLTDSNAGSSPITSGATSFMLPTAINYNGSYAVTVQTQPTGQTCTVNNGTGSNVTANVSTVTVSCFDNAPPTPLITSVTPVAGGLQIAFTTQGVSSASSSVKVASVDYMAACSSTNGGVTGSATGAASPITVSNLTAGKSYTCTVSAADGAGTSPPSAPSAATIPLPPPTPANPIPTLSEWAQITMMLVMAATGGLYGWRTKQR